MESLLEKRLHRGGGQVAAADEPLVSLMDDRDVKGGSGRLASSFLGVAVRWG
jgi:hypothetical protein